MLVAVKVVRPTMIGGERAEPGDVFELPQAQALDAVSGGRVELVEPVKAEPVAEAPKPRKRAKAEPVEPVQE
jgi:hypothetical protein